MGRSGTAGRVSEAWTAATRDKVTVRGRDADAVHGRHVDRHVGCVADSWAMIPPGRVKDPVSLSGAPIALSVKGSSSAAAPTVMARRT